MCFNLLLYMYVCVLILPNKHHSQQMSMLARKNLWCSPVGVVRTCSLNGHLLQLGMYMNDFIVLYKNGIPIIAVKIA